MHNNIDRGHGVVLSFLKGVRQSPLLLGLEVNASQYGGSRSEQTYTFDDGAIANMDIVVRNSFTNVMLQARYYPLAMKTFQPYFTAKGGYSFFTTNLSIYDPNDLDHCAPVESEMLQHDGALVGSVGGGVQTDLSAIFRSLEANRLLFEISVHYTRGGRATYMNANKPDGHLHTRPSDVTADFINTQTQVVHKHHVGYLFSSDVEMIEFRGGITYRFGF